MAVRKFNARGKTTGKFASLKMSKMIYWESVLERDYFYLLEFDKNVIGFYEQPFKIHYMFENKKRSYTPDVLVKRIDSTIVVEVKPEDELKDPDNILKFEVSQQFCKQEGYKFKVVTEKNIRVEPILKNIRMLYRYAKQNVPIGLQQKIKDIIQMQIDEIFLKDLCDLLTEDFPNNNMLPYIYSMVYHRALLMDISQPLTMASKISVNK